jgi:hypothetical protein
VIGAVDEDESAAEAEVEVEEEEAVMDEGIAVGARTAPGIELALVTVSSVEVVTTDDSAEAMFPDTVDEMDDSILDASAEDDETSTLISMAEAVVASEGDARAEESADMAETAPLTDIVLPALGRDGRLHPPFPEPCPCACADAAPSTAKIEKKVGAARIVGGVCKERNCRGRLGKEMGTEDAIVKKTADSESSFNPCITFRRGPRSEHTHYSPTDPLTVLRADRM